MHSPRSSLGVLKSLTVWGTMMLLRMQCVLEGHVQGTAQTLSGRCQLPPAIDEEGNASEMRTGERKLNTCAPRMSLLARRTRVSPRGGMSQYRSHILPSSVPCCSSIYARDLELLGPGWYEGISRCNGVVGWKLQPFTPPLNLISPQTCMLIFWTLPTTVAQTQQATA